MSIKGPKSKDSDKSRLSSFSSVFSKKEPAKGEATNTTLLRKEPVFTNETEDLSNLSREILLDSTDRKYEAELDSLRGEVEKISRSSQSEGTLTTDQSEVLKRYIGLKEAEVRDLKDQQRQYQSYLKKVSAELEKLTQRNRELLSELQVVRRQEESLRDSADRLRQKYEEDLVLLKNDYEEKLSKSGNYEAEADELIRKREEWREKVKEDLKRIKLKERELENKHELLKRDTQALLDSKDKHVLELKKKNDALELELESLEERLRKNNSILGAVSAKKRRLIETMKLAINLLDAMDKNAEDDPQSNDPERKVG